MASYLQWWPREFLPSCILFLPSRAEAYFPLLWIWDSSMNCFDHKKVPSFESGIALWIALTMQFCLKWQRDLALSQPYYKEASLAFWRMRGHVWESKPSSTKCQTWEQGHLGQPYQLSFDKPQEWAQARTSEKPSNQFILSWEIINCHYLKLLNLWFVEQQ